MAAGNISMGEIPPIDPNVGDMWINDKGQVAMFGGDTWIFLHNATHENTEAEDDQPVVEINHCSPAEAKIKEDSFMKIVKC